VKGEVRANQNTGGKMQTRSKLLTISEAAQELSVKPKTLRAWIGAKRITVVRPGGWSIRIPASEIERIVAEGTVTAVEDRR
jgi:excisionase family DNA binding protein